VGTGVSRLKLGYLFHLLRGDALSDLVSSFVLQEYYQNPPQRAKLSKIIKGKHSALCLGPVPWDEGLF
jgi:hypothetical protein